MLLTSLACISSCSKSSLQVYIDEAEQLCKVYHPESLKKMELHKPANSFKIAEAIRNVVKSEPFLAIIKEVQESNFRSFYAALQPKVSSLIGEEWQCTDMLKNETMIYQRSDRQVDPSGRNLMVQFRITDAGSFFIDNKKYIYKNKNTWDQALSSYLIENGPWDIVVHYPQDSALNIDLELVRDSFNALDIDKRHYHFVPYVISEYETLKKLGVVK